MKMKLLKDQDLNNEGEKHIDIKLALSDTSKPLHERAEHIGPGLPFCTSSH